jgi:hypothetical protein
MTSSMEPALQGRIDAYLKRLRQALGKLPADEAAEIVRELRGHIVERAEAMQTLNEDVLTDILDSLGAPEDIASLYQSRAMVTRARRSRSPLLILKTTIGWAGKSLAGLVTFFVGLFGYCFGLGFVVGAVLKVFYPERVGLWVGPHRWNLSMGTLSAAEQARDHARELLGWWLIPVGLVVGPLVLLLTTLLLRWALRFAFPRTFVRRSQANDALP